MRETRENKKGNAAIIEGESEFSSRIALYRPKMNAIQNKIADFLLQDEKAAAEMSIYEMAQQIGTSVATVTRFCQMIGYEGLADMKFHMQQQAVAISQDIGILRSDSINVIKQKSLQFSEASLHSCLMDLDNDVLEKAVEAVGKADQIMLCAMGNAAGIALSGAALLMSMGFDAFTVSDYLLQMRTAARLGKKDVLIAISYDGQAKTTGDSMMLAKKVGASVILITSVRDSLLSKYADYVLYTPARTGGNSMNITATALCQMSILHVLALGAVTRYYERVSRMGKQQMALSDLSRYDVRQKEIGVGYMRQETE